MMKSLDAGGRQKDLLRQCAFPSESLEKLCADGIVEGLGNKYGYLGYKRKVSANIMNQMKVKLEKNKYKDLYDMRRALNRLLVETSGMALIVQLPNKVKHASCPPLLTPTVILPEHWHKDVVLLKHRTTSKCDEMVSAYEEIEFDPKRSIPDPNNF